MHGLCASLALMGIIPSFAAAHETASRFSQYRPIYGLPVHWMSECDEKNTSVGLGFSLYR